MLDDMCTGKPECDVDTFEIAELIKPEVSVDDYTLVTIAKCATGETAERLAEEAALADESGDADCDAKVGLFAS
jgi:hypothetical protein